MKQNQNTDRWDQLTSFTEEEVNKLLLTHIPEDVEEWHPLFSEGPHKESIAAQFLIWVTTGQNLETRGITHRQLHRTVRQKTRDLLSRIEPNLEKEPTRNRGPRALLYETISWVRAMNHGYVPVDQDNQTLTRSTAGIQFAQQGQVRLAFNPDQVFVKKRLPLDPVIDSWAATKAALQTLLNGLKGDKTRTAERNSGSRIDTEELFYLRYMTDRMDTTTPIELLHGGWETVARHCDYQDPSGKLFDRFRRAAHYNYNITGTELVCLLQKTSADTELLRLLTDGLEQGCHNVPLNRPANVMHVTQGLTGRLAVLQHYVPGLYLFDNHTTETERFLRTRYPNIDNDTAYLMAQVNPGYVLRDITSVLGK